MNLKSYLVSIDQGDHRKLKRLAQERGGSLSELLRHIVRRYLDEHEGKKHTKLRGGKQMATYREIQDEVRRTSGKVVSTCWIADCKEINGLPIRRAWNRFPGRRSNPSPGWARKAIQRALRQFGML